MSSLVIIPSAKLIPIELQAEFGSIPTAMIPINSRPAIHYISNCFDSKVSFLIATHDAQQFIQTYCRENLESRNIHLADVGDTNSLAETIMRSVQVGTDTLPSQLYLNFADTAVGDKIPSSGDFIFYAKAQDLYRWTAFQLVHNKITNIIDKNELKPYDQDWMIFVGVFGIADADSFIKLLKKESAEKKIALDPLYKALQSYYNQSENVNFIEAQKWYDFGHLDTYYESKKRLSSISRHFNQINVDSLRGVITKSSKNREKFIGEIEWYLKLPSKLQYIAPRVFDYSIHGNEPFVSMEFYGYPTLNDLYLYANLDLGEWFRIFDSINSVVSEMKDYTLNTDHETDLISSMKSMYETKTFDRIQSYVDNPLFASFKHQTFCNKHSLMSLPEVIQTLPEVLSLSGVYNNPRFCVIHGDLCFSNILYDRRNGIVRVIDPRGSFGKYDIYGDSTYDRAKLSHSIRGDYDFLVQGLFDLRHNGNEFILCPHLSPAQIKIKELFDQINLNGDVIKVRLIESLLFLSMIPLHSDRPRSQIAFILKGLELFSNIAKSVL